ncbi:MAG TPA: branched-chain amino acid ABC transporter ATP-binding protein/permease [Nitriliruptorales bacterium]
MPRSDVLPGRDVLQRQALPVAGVLVAVAVPLVLGQSQLLSLALAGSTIIALLSLNALLGYAGQISLGQAAFVGTGGFIALQMASRGLPLILTVPATGLAVGALTALVGLPSLRIRGLAVAVATLVYGIFAQQYLFEASWFNGGGSLFVDPLVSRADFLRIYLITLAFLVALVLVDRALLRTKLGRAFIAVRDAEDRAVAFGVQPGPTKLAAYGLSGFMAGIAGALVAYQVGIISGSDYGVLASLEFLAITVVGGAGSRAGVIAAGLLLVAFPALVPPPDPQLSPLISALLLIVVVMYLPSGLGGIHEVSRNFNDWIRRRFEAGGADLAKGIAAVPLWSFTLLLGARRWRAWVATAAGALLVLAILAANAGRVADAEAAGESFTPAFLVAAVLAVALAVATAWWSRPEPADAAAIDELPEGALDAGDGAAERAKRAAANAQVVRSVPRDLTLRLPTRVMFEARDVGMRFGGVQALQHIDLEVREGEIVGLIGANGAGKSTFYNVVSGFVGPTSGSQLTYKGRDLLALPPDLRSRLGIARTFQHMGLIREQTVQDNVLLGQHWLADYDEWLGLMRLGGAVRTEQELRRRARLALEIFGLEGHLHDRLGSLSYGTMRMVELSAAVASGSDLLFFDEASAGLSPDEAHGLADRFHALRDELGLTLVVIEHHVPLIARVCDYVYCLASGRKLAEGEPAHIQDHPDVIAEFLGRSQIEKANA